MGVAVAGTCCGSVRLFSGKRRRTVRVATRRARARAKESRMSAEEATRRKARATRALEKAASKELVKSAENKDTGPQIAGPEWTWWTSTRTRTSVKCSLLEEYGRLVKLRFRRIGVLASRQPVRGHRDRRRGRDTSAGGRTRRLDERERECG